MRRFFAAVLLVFSLATPLAAAQPLTLRDLAGDWIDVRYAAALEQTRSPLAAAKVQGPTSFSLREEGGRWRLHVTDFHEGYQRPVAGIGRVSGDAYELVVGEPEAETGNSQRIRISVTTRDGKLLVRGPIFDQEQVATYRRIDEPVERWAARLLLAGRYVDAHGRSASFAADGTAQLPGAPPFTFTVILDTSEACCDYVNTDRKSKSRYTDRIAYRWSGKSLELYDVITDPDAECPIASAKTPFTVLRKP